ncbi:MAG: dephospho-CoA kinase [Candidatus Gastranaerophilales bacterium]|nr:dephospho-CoA kinase [Candidatus Gastranaerophilales bacterium]
MLKIAITGNIAAGKSSVEEFLREKGFSVFDADEVVHELLDNETVKSQVVLLFAGKDILEDNRISRKKLGKIIFADEKSRKELEKILHPLVKDEIRQFFHQKEEQGEKIAFVSVPLLFEAKFESLFDKIVLIYADDEIRIKRLIERNNLPLEYAQNRLKIQISQDEKTSLADYVIYNNKTFESLRKNLEELLINL